MFNFNLKRLSQNQQTTWLLLDVVMLVLLMVNLGWLIFDWLFTYPWFASLVAGISQTAHDLYAEKIQPYFWQIDLVFIGIFLSEFALRWVVAVRRETYFRWYFYPFLHWYELLGCIPLAGFRALRFLRIFSMLFRLQKLGVIDIRKTAVGRFAGRYYNVFVEEVSDRVVLNVLDGVKHELDSGQPVVRRVIDEVILEQKPVLVERLGQRVERIIKDNYSMNREQIEAYVDQLINQAVEQSQDVERLRKIPLFGDPGVTMLERTIAQIVFAVVDGLVGDLESVDNREVIEQVISATLEELLSKHRDLDVISNQMVIDAVEIIQDRVRVQRWREQFKPAKNDDQSEVS